MPNPKKVKEMSYAVMFVSLLAVNVQFVSMLTELKKVLSLELKCLFK
jgi:hypothetical protein